MATLWQEIKQDIRSVLPQKSFSLWIDPIVEMEAEDDRLILGCPNKFSSDWVKENYLPIIEEGLRNAGATHVDLIVKTRAAAPTANNNDSRERDQLSFPEISPPKGPRILPFNNAFTFDRFVVGPPNEFAYSASKAFAHSCCNYQTLLMLANTGLGKTHLSQAVGQEILQEQPDIRVNYITAEQFTNEMISALKNNTIEAFKDKYRRCCDVLLLDEVHFLNGKQKTQSELGHTLDALTNHRKKVIFTSSLPPKDMPRLSSELSSRLTSGLVAKIDRPDYETRVNILTRKASEHQIALSEEVIHLLAARLKRDIRQIESALHYLKAKSELFGVTIDKHLVKDVLNCLVAPEGSASMDDIKLLVCKYYKIEPESLSSKSRKKCHAQPRNIYAYLCRRYTDEPVEKIARSVGRTHSTILYASETIEKRLKTDLKLKNQVHFLSRKLEPHEE